MLFRINRIVPLDRTKNFTQHGFVPFQNPFDLFLIRNILALKAAIAGWFNGGLPPPPGSTVLQSIA